MIISLLIGALSAWLLSRGGAVFLHETLLKSTEKRIKDEARRERVLGLLRCAEDILKAMQSRRERYRKALAEAANDRATTADELRYLGCAISAAHQSARDTFAEIRVKCQPDITDEEWQAILDDAGVRSDVDIKKRRDALEGDRRKASDKLRKLFADVPDKVELEKRLDAFTEACHRLIEETLSHDIHTNEVLRNRSATVEELKDLYDSLKARREECIDTFAGLHEALAGSFPPDSWKKIGAALADLS